MLIIYLEINYLPPQTKFKITSISATLEIFEEENVKIDIFTIFGCCKLYVSAMRKQSILLIIFLEVSPSAKKPGYQG